MSNSVELTLTNENQFSESIPVPSRGGFNFSLKIPSAFSGTVTLQRRFNIADPSDWRTVEKFVDTEVEATDTDEAGAQYRFGIETGDFTSGEIIGRFSNGSI